MKNALLRERNFACCCLLAILLMTPAKMHAQAIQSVFDNLLNDVSTGNLYVRSIAQDEQGFIWFATWEGLIRYDGMNYKIFRHENDNPYSLADNQVNALLKSADGTFWIGTRKGLCRYDQNRNQFQCFFKDYDIYSLAEDRKNHLWIGTIDKGLIRMNAQRDKSPDEASSMRFVHNESDSATITGNTIWSIAFDQKGNGWVATSNGLDIIAPSTQSHAVVTFNHIRHNPNDATSISNDKVLGVFADNRNNIWFTSLKAMVDVLPSESLEKKEFRFQHLLPALESVFKTAITSTNSLYVDPSGTCWLGSVEDGLFRVSMNEKFEINNPIRYTHGENDEKSLPDNAVWSFYKDSNHQLWIGTQTAVAKYHPRIENFYHIPLHAPAFNLEKISVAGIGSDQQNVIWFFNIADTVFCFVPGKNSLRKLSLSTLTGNSGIANSVMLCSGNDDVFFGSIDGLYLLGREEKLRFLTKENYSPQLLKIPPSDNSMSEKIQSLCEDQQGNIYVGTGQGFYMASAPDFKTQTIIGNTERKGLNPSCIIRDAVVASDSSVWIATDHGLFRYFPSTKKMDSYYHRQDDSLSIPDDAITRLAEGSNGVIWIGTRSGLYSFNTSSGKFRRYHLPALNRLLSISTINKDNQGRIWMSTNQGIYRIHPEHDEVIHFTRKKGLITNLFYSAASFVRSDGMFLMGSDHGFVSFYPDSIEDFKSNAKVVLTDFLLFNQSVLNESSGNPLLLSFLQDKALKLRYDQNFFTIYFSMLDFTDPSLNQFEYRLTNLDDDWVNAGNRNFASYTNVLPGDYQFEVRGSGNELNNSWNAMLQINITPPWWRTWWFYLLCLIAVTLVIYSLYRYRINQLMKLQAVRNRIATDLHDEIGSTLNSISIFSELAKQKIPGEMQELDEIGESSRNVIDAMSDIVWTINPENDSFDKIIFRMRSLVHRLMQAKNIEYTFQISENLHTMKLSMLARKNFFLIFKEALNNMVKYSKAATAEFQLGYSDQHIVLRIHDDGVGFDLQNDSAGNGLLNMKKRAEEINASLIIESKVNNGTGIELKLKV